MPIEHWGHGSGLIGAAEFHYSSSLGRICIFGRCGEEEGGVSSGQLVNS